MKFLLSILIAVIFPSMLFSQMELRYEWTIQNGGDDKEDFLEEMEVDADGNLYFLFNTKSSVVHVQDSVGTGAGAYFVKTDPDGKIQWMKFAHATDWVQFMKLKFTSEGEACILAAYYGTVWVDDTTFTSTESHYSHLILKYNTSGEAVWIKTTDISPGFEVLDMALDPDDNLYFTGINDEDYIIFDGDTIYTHGGMNMPVIKLDPSGNFVWGIITDCQGYFARATASTFDPGGNLILAGNYIGYELIYGNDTIHPTCYENILISSVSPDGEFNWLKLYGSSGSFYAFDLICDTASNILLTGSVRDTLYFPNDTIVNESFFDQAAVFKFTPDGDFEWVTQSQGRVDLYGQATGGGITLDDNGNIWFSGRFNNKIQLGSYMLYLGNQNFCYNNFISQLDENGNVLYAQAIYGNVPVDYGVHRNILFSGGKLYFSGYFCETATYGDETFSSYGQSDNFLSKFYPQSIGIESRHDKSPVEISYYRQKIHISKLDEHSSYHLRIITLSGQEILGREIRNCEQFELELPANPGILLVEVRSSKERICRKIITR